MKIVRKEGLCSITVGIWKKIMESADENSKRGRIVINNNWIVIESDGKRTD
jgi:hypothetical protein